MDKETAWYLFEQTGNIEAYMLYNDLTGGIVPPGVRGGAHAARKGVPKPGGCFRTDGNLPPRVY